MIKLTEREQKASEAIVIAMNAVLDMDDRFELNFNNAELYIHVHGLQKFVQQHVLNRLDNDKFSNWWTKPKE